VLTVGATVGATASSVHLEKALRDAIRGVGGPATWRKTVDEQNAEIEQAEEEAATQRTIGQVGAGAAVAEQVGNAGQALGLIQPPAPAGSAPAGASGEAPTQGAAPGGAPGGMPQGIDLSGALAALGGGAGGAPPAQGAPVMPAPNAELLEMRQMMKRMSMQLTMLEEAITKPKKITVTRDAKGKITGATSGQGENRMGVAA
jgi:hypothetical protein